jgi:hypothetical protein
MLDPCRCYNGRHSCGLCLYPKEGDPDWRSINWIMPEECASQSQARAILRCCQHWRLVGRSRQTPPGRFIVSRAEAGGTRRYSRR